MNRPKTKCRYYFWELASLLWGFAESTIFFIVPDVLLSLAVLERGAKHALRCLIFAVLGALVGVTSLYFYAAQNSEEALRIVAKVPAISQEMIAELSTELDQDSTLSVLLKAGITGVPIKIAAALAPSKSIPLLFFLLCAAFARSLRFLLTWTASTALCWMLTDLSKAARRRTLWSLWILFYSIYFFLLLQ